MDTVKGALKNVLSWLMIAIIGGLVHTVLAVRDLEAARVKKEKEDKKMVAMVSNNSKLLCALSIQLLSEKDKAAAIKNCKEAIGVNSN